MKKWNQRASFSKCYSSSPQPWSKGSIVKTLNWMSWWSDHIKILYPHNLPSILWPDSKFTRQNAGNDFDSLSPEETMLWIQAQIFEAWDRHVLLLKKKKKTLLFIQKSLANFAWVSWAWMVLWSLEIQTKPSFLPYKMDYSLRIPLRYCMEAQPASLCAFLPVASSDICTHYPFVSSIACLEL